ncbi:MAG: cytochrome c oxidase accessory protein CcoG [Betaproteobacteria bacterium]|nr:cytochrome c oxidase accessory protein CcoG [Betaproteobacteria bacterium]
MPSPASTVPAAKIELYRSKRKIHPRAVNGRFNTLRWLVVWVTQIIFYGGCWLSWDNRQALLFDIAHEKLYLFGLVLWPQDALLLALALILAATGLFLVTAVAGRLFCGFACPQTVYTSIFMWIEAKVEGDHLARRKLDQRPLDADKLLRRGAKHGLWLAIALWTGITFVGYFIPIRELLDHLRAATIGPWEAFWLVFYSLFTYLQAGFTREMVCQHMCPYSRFQGVMFDPDSRSTSYDARRGEPRGVRSQGSQGDCVDCGICVQVCPTGIDIRDGLQYQCINCGLCIDACDTVMAKTGRPAGLIRFASERELSLALSQPLPQSSAPAKLARSPWQRPRVLVYIGVFALFSALGAWTLAQRSLLLVDVLRDRGTLLRETASGEYESAYTLKLMNLAEGDRHVRIAVSGVPGIHLVGKGEYLAPAGAVMPVQVTVAVPGDTGLSGIQTIHFQASGDGDPHIQRDEPSTFVLP